MTAKSSPVTRRDIWKATAAMACVGLVMSSSPVSKFVGKSGIVVPSTVVDIGVAVIGGAVIAGVFLLLERRFEEAERRLEQELGAPVRWRVQYSQNIAEKRYL